MRTKMIAIAVSVVVLVVAVALGWASWHWKPQPQVPQHRIGTFQGAGTFQMHLGEASSVTRRFKGEVIIDPRLKGKLLIEIDLLENFSLEEIDQVDRIEETQ